MGTVSLAAPLHSVPRRVLQPMKGLPHLLTAVLSFFATGAQRALRRNPCSLLLIVLLSPWAYFVWQVHSHFGGLVVSPLRTYESRSLAPVQVPPAPPPVLLVTALYPLSHASHSLQYRSWLANFLGRVTTDVYMYAPPELGELIRELRGDLPLHLNTSFASVNDLPVFSELLKAFTWQVSRDEDTGQDSPELQMLRLTEPWFLSEALNHLHQSGRGVSGQQGAYRYAFWVDADTLRERHPYSDWPNLERIDSVWSAGEELTGRHMDQLIFVPIDRQPSETFRAWTPDDGPIQDETEFSEGTFFGGAPEAMAWLSRAFYALLQEYLARDYTVRNERSIMNSLLFLHPERFITVWNRDPATAEDDDASASSARAGLGDCGGSPWHYFAWWLASEAEQDEMNVLWSATRWRWDFWREATMCTTTRPLPVKDVLSRTFGADWTPPPLLPS